jgi:hypothetical protein
MTVCMYLMTYLHAWIGLYPYCLDIVSNSNKNFPHVPINPFFFISFLYDLEQQGSQGDILHIDPWQESKFDLGAVTRRISRLRADSEVH